MGRNDSSTPNGGVTNWVNGTIKMDLGTDKLFASSGVLKSSPFSIGKDGSMIVSTHDNGEKMGADFLTFKKSSGFDNEVKYRPAAQKWTVCTP